jgi:hypothetical protein
VLLFIAKTWFLWWTLASLIALRWFYVLSRHCRLEVPNPVRAVEAAVEEETEYIVAWQLLRNAQPVSWSRFKDAF